MSEKMIKCKSCGNDIASSAKACPNCGAKNKKPIFKKWWFWLIIVIVLIAIIGGASGGDETDTTTAPAGNNVSTQAAAETEPVNEGELGAYQVEIKNARLTKDYEGKDVVVITYRFTNNGEEAASFAVAFDAAAYQNDIGLNESYVLKNGDPYSSDNQIKEIKTGATLDVDVAYELNDSDSDIVVEVEELFGWTDEKVTRTFSIK